MTPALARTRPAAPRPDRATSLRVVRPVDALDLDAALVDALGPHAVRGDDPDTEPAPTPARRTVSPRVRRNRVRAVLVALGLALVLGVGLGALGTGVDAGAPAPQGATVTVEPGQTLWDVAAQATPPGGDVRATLVEIRRLNGLAGTRVPAWTPVVLPAD